MKLFSSIELALAKSALKAWQCCLVFISSFDGATSETVRMLGICWEFC